MVSSGPQMERSGGAAGRQGHEGHSEDEATTCNEEEFESQEDEKDFVYYDC